MPANATNMGLTEQEIIRREKLSRMQENQCDPYAKNHFSVSASALYIASNYEECCDRNYSIAGRIMFRRIMGKATFAHIQDKTGSIQIYVRRDEVGDAAYDFFKKDW